MRKPQKEERSAIDAALTAAGGLPNERAQTMTLDVLRELKCSGAVGRINKDENFAAKTRALWPYDVAGRVIVVASELKVRDLCRRCGPWFGKIDGRGSSIAEAFIPRIEIRCQVIGDLTITDKTTHGRKRQRRIDQMTDDLISNIFPTFIATQI